MSVYTVYEPPLRPADPMPDPERVVFVREGFSFWAFLLTPFWMLWHRIWLILAAYLVVTGGLEAILVLLRTSLSATLAAGLLISLLVGLEAGTLRRFALRRRGWKEVGLVSSNDREVAERRFFATWRRDGPSQPAASSGGPSAPASPSPRSSQIPTVIGLFPEPGGQR